MALETPRLTKMPSTYLSTNRRWQRVVFVHSSVGHAGRWRDEHVSKALDGRPPLALDCQEGYGGGLHASLGTSCCGNVVTVVEMAVGKLG